jgi:outer membrane protein assembly factor BamA
VYFLSSFLAKIFYRFFLLLPALGGLLYATIPAYAQGKKSTSDLNPNTGYITYDSVQSPYIILQDVEIKGNKITKDRIILREIGIKNGDTLLAKDIQYRLLWIKNRIFNTTLFLWVDLDLSGPDSLYKTLYIGVRERFYFTPLPNGGLADRNFNEWWVDRNRDLSRIDYGIKLKQKNLWGLNHTMYLKANTGFNKKAEIIYTIPYINKKLKTGLIINTLMVFNRQVAFRSFEHKLDYIELEGYGRKRFEAGVFLTRRNKFYHHHQAGPYLHYTSVDDTIAHLNPDYFLNGASWQRAWGFRYTYTSDHRDFIHYPLKGYFLKSDIDYQYQISRQNIHVAGWRAEYTQFVPLSKRFYFAASARGKISFPYKQPYYSQRGLGYNKEWVSGYELYVVDGQMHGLLKTNLRWQVFSINPTIKFIPLRKFRTIPISMYFKAYSDGGYVVDNTFNPDNNFLSNRLLIGGGLGVDVVTYYDIVGRIEYSINRMGQTGIFLHLKAGL